MNAGPSVSPTEPGRRRLTARRIVAPIFGLLAIEFVLGVSLSLFVALPSGAGVVAVLTSSPVLVAHVLVAVLLIGISARAVAVSLGEPTRVPLFASLLTLVSSIVATVDGSLFAFDGQSADASFGMAMGFLGVLVGTFLLLASASREPVLVPAPRPQGAP
jgi:hypothetical protein